MDEGVLGTNRCVPSEITLTGALARTSTPTQWFVYTMLPSTCTYSNNKGASRGLAGGSPERDTCLKVTGKLVVSSNQRL